MAIVEACRGMVIKAPEADIKIDSENLHSWLRPRIGQVNNKGQFNIVNESPGTIRPEVYSAAMDPDKECKDGGQFFMRKRKVPPRKVTRTIIPQ